MRIGGSDISDGGRSLATLRASALFIVIILEKLRDKVRLVAPALLKLLMLMLILLVMMLAVACVCLKNL